MLDRRPGRRARQPGRRSTRPTARASTRAPRSSRLTFSERVSVGLGGVRVLDADGDPVEDGAARGGRRGRGGRRSQPDLPDGTYVVSYRVISADGHPVRGASVFGVGAGELDAGAAGTGRRRLGRPHLGGDRRDRSRPSPTPACSSPPVGWRSSSLVHRGGAERDRLRRIVFGGAAVVGASASLVALAGAGRARDRAGARLALRRRRARARWPRTAWGSGWCSPSSGWASSAADRAGRGAGGAASRRLVRDQRHTRAARTRAGDRRRPLAPLGRGRVDGRARAALAAPARPAEDDRTDTVRVVGRFSTLATADRRARRGDRWPAGWLEVRSLDALTSTGYGQLLIAKVLLVAGRGARRLQPLPAGPALAAGSRGGAGHSAHGRPRGPHRRRRRRVTRCSSWSRPPDEADGVVERIVELGDAGSVQLTVAPARAGFNQIHLYLFDPDGRPPRSPSPHARADLPAADLGPSPAKPSRRPRTSSSTRRPRGGRDWTIGARPRRPLHRGGGGHRGPHRPVTDPKIPDPRSTTP